MVSKFTGELEKVRDKAHINSMMSKIREWKDHTWSNNELYETYETDAKQGITKAKAEAYLKKNGKNYVTPPNP